MRVPARDNVGQTGDWAAADGFGIPVADGFGIRANVLIPGRGDPVCDGAVVVKDGKLEWVGPYSKVPSKFSPVAFQHVPVLMPGLWDVHTHYVGLDVATSIGAQSSTYLPGHAALVGALTVDDLRRTLNAGFTSVVELGGLAGAVWPAVEKGIIVGPNVYSSFAILSITGGHADQHNLPLRTVQSGYEMEGVACVCDGEVECLKAVRGVIRRGAKVIKVSSTGGVLSINDLPEDAQFSPAELKVMVDEAARSGRVVVAHAIGKEGIMHALHAGVKAIEHGCYLDEEAAALMKEKDAFLVPTRRIVEYLVRNHAGLDPGMVTKVNRMAGLSRASLQLAVKAGVRIACGTDTVSSDCESGLAHGGNAEELRWAVAAGMTPLQAIETATANAPETLGAMAPKSGQLKAG